MEHLHYSVHSECSYVNLARCGCIAAMADGSRMPQYNTRQVDSSSWAIRNNTPNVVDPEYDVNHQAPTTTSESTDASDMTALAAGLRDGAAPSMNQLVSSIQGQPDLGPCLALTTSNIFRINQASRGAIGWKDPYGNVVPLHRRIHRTPSTHLTRSSITSSWVFVGDEGDDHLVQHVGVWIQHTDLPENKYPPSVELDVD